jgi:hypothetical protein
MSPKLRATVIAGRERRSRLEVRMLRGETNQVALAAAFGVSKSTIHRDMQRIEREWEKRRLKTSTSERYKAIRFYEHIKCEAMNEWERSKQDARERHVTEEDGDGESKGKRTTKKVKRQRDGNPAFLHRAHAAQDRIDKICGNESPIQIEEKKELTVVDKQQQKSLRDVGRELGLDFSRIGTGDN